MPNAVDPKQINEDDREYKNLIILIEKIKKTFDKNSEIKCIFFHDTYFKIHTRTRL